VAIRDLIKIEFEVRGGNTFYIDPDNVVCIHDNFDNSCTVVFQGTSGSDKSSVRVPCRAETLYKELLGSYGRSARPFGIGATH
jgi:hypothetical protein